MFFPSLPFMGVMLFPSFVLGNASGESGASLAPLFPFFFTLPLSLLSSSLFSFLPLLFSFLPLLFSFLPKLLSSLFFFSCFPLPSFPSSFHYIFLLCPFFASFSCFPFFFFFFLRELLVLNAFQDVIEDTTYCNRMQFN